MRSLKPFPGCLETLVLLSFIGLSPAHALSSPISEDNLLESSVPSVSQDVVIGQTVPAMPPPDRHPNRPDSTEPDPLNDPYPAIPSPSRPSFSNPSVDRSPPTLPPSVQAVNDYVLGAGDRLRIEVFDAPEYNTDVQVLVDGSVQLPFVGDVLVRGLTIEQATNLVSRRYSSILKRPIVSIQVLETRPIILAVAGEVNRPGSYTVSATGTEGIPTVTRAIQLAGGITQSANIREVQVLRANPRSTDPGMVISVDLWKLIQEADLGQDILLQDGDRIMIPEALALNIEEASDLASANFSPDIVTVNVIGEVGSPGAVQVAPNTPLNQALLAAGGFNTRARRRRVQLVRLNPNGTVSKRDIEVDLAADANEENNPPLRPNDTIIVGRSTFTRAFDIIGPVLSAVSGFIRIFGF